MIKVYSTEFLVSEQFNQFICLYLFNFCKYVFSTAGTSSADFGDIVNPDAYSPAVEKLEENSFIERNFKEDSIDIESSQKYDDSCISLESKDSLPSTDLEKASFKGKLSQEDKESLEFSNLHERPNSEDSKTTESPLVNINYVYCITNFIINIKNSY